jgi:hypothetical protein
MAKNKKRNTLPASPVLPTGENYAYKPFKIGPVLQAKAVAKGFDEKYIAAYLGIYWRSVYKIFEQSMLSIPKLMKWSEMFEENLLLLYRPNVKPPADPCEQMVKENVSLRKEVDRLEDSLAAEKAFRLKDAGKIEELEELLKGYLMRR